MHERDRQTWEVIVTSRRIRYFLTSVIKQVITALHDTNAKIKHQGVLVFYIRMEMSLGGRERASRAVRVCKCQRLGECSWHLTPFEMSALGQATRTTLSMSSIWTLLNIMHAIWFVRQLSWRNYYKFKKVTE